MPGPVPTVPVPVAPIYGGIGRNSRARGGDFISINEFGPEPQGTGSSKTNFAFNRGSCPVSSFFGTGAGSLALAQARYPDCVSLDDETFWCAFMLARRSFVHRDTWNSPFNFAFGGRLWVPSGSYYTNRSCVIEGATLGQAQFTVEGENGTYIAGNMDPSFAGYRAISSISASGGATLVSLPVAHGLIAGDSARLRGANNVLNGIWRITVVSPTSFTIPVNFSNLTIDPISHDAFPYGLGFYQKSTPHIVVYGPASNTTIKNITLLGVRYVPSTYTDPWIDTPGDVGIYAEGAARITIDNVVAQNFRNEGIYLKRCTFRVINPVVFPALMDVDQPVTTSNQGGGGIHEQNTRAQSATGCIYLENCVDSTFIDGEMGASVQDPNVPYQKGYLAALALNGTSNTAFVGLQQAELMQVGVSIANCSTLSFSRLRADNCRGPAVNSPSSWDNSFSHLLSINNNVQLPSVELRFSGSDFDLSSLTITMDGVTYGPWNGNAPFTSFGSTLPNNYPALTSTSFLQAAVKSIQAFFNADVTTGVSGGFRARYNPGRAAPFAPVIYITDLSNATPSISVSVTNSTSGGRTGNLTVSIIGGGFQSPPSDSKCTIIDQFGRANSYDQITINSDGNQFFLSQRPNEGNPFNVFLIPEYAFLFQLQYGAVSPSYRGIVTTDFLFGGFHQLKALVSPNSTWLPISQLEGQYTPPFFDSPGAGGLISNGGSVFLSGLATNWDFAEVYEGAKLTINGVQYTVNFWRSSTLIQITPALPTGPITASHIEAAGTGFANGTYALGVTGDGTGCTGTYTCSGGGVTTINITAGGTNYNSCTFSFPSGGGTGAFARGYLFYNLPYTWDFLPAITVPGDATMGLGAAPGNMIINALKVFESAQINGDLRNYFWHGSPVDSSITTAQPDGAVVMKKDGAWKAIVPGNTPNCVFHAQPAGTGPGWYRIYDGGAGNGPLYCELTFNSYPRLASAADCYGKVVIDNHGFGPGFNDITVKALFNSPGGAIQKIRTSSDAGTGFGTTHCFIDIYLDTDQGGLQAGQGFNIFCGGNFVPAGFTNTPAFSTTPFSEPFFAEINLDDLPAPTCIFQAQASGGGPGWYRVYSGVTPGGDVLWLEMLFFGLRRTDTAADCLGKVAIDNHGFGFGSNSLSVKAIYYTLGGPISKVRVTNDGATPGNCTIDIYVEVDLANLPSGFPGFKLYCSGNFDPAAFTNMPSFTAGSTPPAAAFDFVLDLNASGGTPLLAPNNLSDVPNVPLARTNLGLGTSATHPSTDFASALPVCIFQAQASGVGPGWYRIYSGITPGGSPLYIELSFTALARGGTNADCFAKIVINNHGFGFGDNNLTAKTIYYAPGGAISKIRISNDGVTPGNCFIDLYVNVDLGSLPSGFPGFNVFCDGNFLPAGFTSTPAFSATPFSTPATYILDLDLEDTPVPTCIFKPGVSGTGSGWYRVYSGVTQGSGAMWMELRFFGLPRTDTNTDCLGKIIIDNHGFGFGGGSLTAKTLYYTLGGAISKILVGNDGLTFGNCTIDVYVEVDLATLPSGFPGFRLFAEGNFNALGFTSTPAFSSSTPAPAYAFELDLNVEIRSDADRLNGTALSSLTGLLYSTAGVVTAELWPQLPAPNGSGGAIPLTFITSGAHAGVIGDVPVAVNALSEIEFMPLGTGTLLTAGDLLSSDGADPLVVGISATDGDVPVRDGMQAAKWSWQTLVTKIGATTQWFGTTTYATFAAFVAAIQVVLGAILSGSAAGGDFAGTYPNPTLGTSGATAGTYGDGTHVASVTVDAKGRVTSVSDVAITGSTTNITTVVVAPSAPTATTTGTVTVSSIMLTTGTWIIRVRCRMTALQTDGYVTVTLYNGASTAIDDIVFGFFANPAGTLSPKGSGAMEQQVVVSGSETFTVKAQQSNTTSATGGSNADASIIALLIA